MKQLIIICTSLLLLACSRNENKSINIATAANVQFAMQEIGKAFTNESGIECNFIIGSSGKLTAQIKEGAPYDIFLSADMKYPNEIHRSGLSHISPEVYAKGELVLWTMQSINDFAIQDLLHSDTKHIAIANPKLAPYGLAALEVLNHFNLYPQVQDKLVYGESISQVNQFVYSETAQYGFTSKSVVLSTKMKNQGKWIPLPKESYSDIKQAVVLIKREGNTRSTSEKFYKFLFSDSAQKILTNYGYTIPE